MSDTKTINTETDLTSSSAGTPARKTRTRAATPVKNPKVVTQEGSPGITVNGNNKEEILSKGLAMGLTPTGAENLSNGILAEGFYGAVVIVDITQPIIDAERIGRYTGHILLNNAERKPTSGLSFTNVPQRIFVIKGTKDSVKDVSTFQNDKYRTQYGAVSTIHVAFPETKGGVPAIPGLVPMPLPACRCTFRILTEEITEPDGLVWTNPHFQNNVRGANGFQDNVPVHTYEAVRDLGFDDEWFCVVQTTREQIIQRQQARKVGGRNAARGIRGGMTAPDLNAFSINPTGNTLASPNAMAALAALLSSRTTR